MRVDAILPAAGRISGAFAQEAGAEVKALISFAGQTVLERTIATLRATGGLRRIVVVGPPEVLSHPAARGADARLPEGGPSGPDNIFRGLQWLRESDGGQAARALVITTDLPFLTPSAVSDFLAKCTERDICLPIIRREEYEARFPDHRIEYVRLRDGEWTMGCAFLINPTAIEQNRTLIDALFAARKSQLAMARLLGLRFVARFLLGRLATDHIEQRCPSLLGCSGLGVRSCAPELALDIDQLSEYRYVRAHFAQHNAEALP